MAIELDSFNATFLTKRCFLDSTEFPQISQAVVAIALSDARNYLGALSPTVRKWVVDNVKQHEVLEPDQRDAVLDGEP